MVRGDIGILGVYGCIKFMDIGGIWVLDGNSIRLGAHEIVTIN